MKKALLLTFAFALFAALGFSQTGKYWSSNTENRSNIVKYKAALSPAFPKEFTLFNLNIAPLRQQLMRVADNAVSHTTVISLPNANGQIEDFEVVEASNFEPALQAEYPTIRAFSGKGITDRTASLKISICPAGISTMVFRVGKPCEFIEKYSQDQTVYAVFKSQRNKGEMGWTCSTQEQETVNALSAKVSATSAPLSNTGQLKTMRLAQSCNGEYSTYFGASTAGTPADFILTYGGINATLARCNGVYETDLGVHLNIIATNDLVVYFNPATDPYTNLGAWNGQLQTALTANIGEANYDIGHMFGASGGGGNAGCIGCVCVNGQKGSGITSPGIGGPEGDNFDIDYVVHEVGHQMGANHTFSMSNEQSGQNKEVGSGITIMGYAGITNQDDSSHSIAFYHETSIQQIQTNLATKTCPVTTNISANNATPVVAAVNNYTIPISTPFALTGSATDANASDVLTYMWEQDDNASTAQQNAASMASPTKASGPNWLSFNPTLSSTRYCPRLTTILAGNFTTPTLAGGTPGYNVEALSSVSRALHFRLTVRDNHPYSSTAPVAVGQTSFTDMTVTVSNTSGPFKVTVPDATGISWQAGSTQNITWNVTNTTAAPVSCANVKISLSIDGGYTWPIVLVASTPNDGTESITIPNNVTTTARVVIEAVGNIFFDISDHNFTITAPATGFTFNSVAPATVACGGATSASITLATTASGGFVTPINLTAAGNPAGTTVTFGTNPLAPGSSSTVTLTGTNTLTPGDYTITVTGTAGTVVQTSTLIFTVQPGTPPAITAQPADAAVCSGTNASFTVASSAAGVSYQWQVSTTGVGGTFTNIAGATAATYTFSAVQADDGNAYQCIVSYLCGTSTSSAATLTVNTAANITTQPTNVTACVGAPASVSVTATGTNLSYQWQGSPTGVGGTFTDITGATSATLAVPAVTAAMSGSAYQVVVSATGGACTAPAISTAITLTVNPVPALTTNADEGTVCSGTTTIVHVAETSVPTLPGVTYSWTASSGTITSGANTADATVTPTVDPGAPTTPLTITYTVTGTASGCSSTQTVEVIANPLPSVTLTADPANTNLTLPSQVITLTANVTPAGSNYTYDWTQNGSPISNTTSTLQVDVATVGEYGVTVSVGGQCASISNKITVADSIIDRFYIYPNPNAGQFKIQLRNPNLVGNVTCFDSKGARVYVNINAITRLPYQVIDVDLGSASSGVYILTIYDKSGTMMASERVVVRR